MTVQSPYPAQPAPAQGAPVEHYPPQVEGGIDVKDLIAVLRRRRWVIITTVLVITTLAVLAGLQVTPKYTAKTMVMIDSRQAKVMDVEAVMQGLTTDASSVETQIRVIKSRDMVEQAMDRLRLFGDPEFNVALRGDGERPALKVAAGPLEAVFNWLPDEWLIASGLADEPAAAPARASVDVSREAAVERFDKNLKVSQEGRSYVIGVSFTSEDPDKAAKIVNVVANLYVQNQVDSKTEATSRASSWLGDRIQELREEVQKAEAEVEEFRRENNLVSTDGVSLKEKELSDLSREMVTVRAALAESQAKLNLIRDLRAGGGKDLDTVGEVVSSPVIADLRRLEGALVKEETELRTYFGERHPRILNLTQEKENLQAKIQREVDRIIKTLENEVKVQETGIRAIEREMDKLTNKTTVDREVGVKLRQLEREAQASRQMYESLLARFKETREQQQIIDADAKVISLAAPPEKPSTPGPKLFGAVGFTASLMLGTLLALLLERLDSGLRSARQVEQILGLPALGLVPRVERLKKGQKPHQYLITKPLSAYAEALRAIYTAMQLSDVDNPPKVVLVTSSLPQEGKTTLSVSLATFAARSSQRVLLMDLDLRHPSIQRELGFTPSAGFVEYMAGEKRLEEVIETHEETGIDYLPVKRQTANPTDLLGSQKMKQLVQQLRAAYDFVVIDSAPLLGVTDTKIAALLADKVLFVTQWEKTNKDTAVNGLQALRDIRASVAGSVLTQVDVTKHAQYGYGDVGQYYGKYQKYYVN
jgi:polysaccharide biosynthesis transport protein